MKKKGVLLVNLGSPDSASVSDVRSYLREFLMDGRVLDAPYLVRFFVVHCLILPTRPKESAEAYEKVWLPEGSPLVVTSEKQSKDLKQRLNLPVELAMRYKNPSIKSAIAKLSAQGVEELVVLPLFPHYAMSSYESAVERVKEIIAKDAPQMEAQYVPPFYDEPGFIDSLVATAKDHLAGGYDHLLFSFHGLPQRHLKLSDPTGTHCLSCDDCCSGDHPAHKTCYKAQCHKTVEAFIEKAGVPADKYSVAFQSRLGRDPWIMPYTDHVIKELPKQGVKKVLVMCPAFVADCLETIEEIGMRAKEDFIEAGGKELTLIPCVNEHPRWLEALEEMTRLHLGETA
tara:strand:- start:1537 stop:2562 length:1026 start_codon:yes stop_codon:yes gene_type:complete